jgi:OmpA-OmpF porin, OOP family
MRARSFLISLGILVVAVAALLIYLRVTTHATGPTVAASASPVLAENTLPPSAAPAQSASPGESPSASQSPAAPSASPSASEPPPASPGASEAPSATPVPTAEPTVPTPPPGLPPGWERQSDRVVNGPEADLVVRTGSIDNLGFGWPPNFTPFSGKSTPSHQWICTSRPGAAPGTDRNMLGTGVTEDDLHKRSTDGYSTCDKRPDNLPQAIPLAVGDLPATIHSVFVQMFLDDFQAPNFKSHFQVSLNGTRIPNFEDTIDAMDQTGPIGKLVTLPLLPEYWPLLRSQTVNLFIDDPTTGAPDGYAVDFVRLLVNPKPFQYSVTISATVVDAGTQKPIKNATVSAAPASAQTNAAGTGDLRGVPAGLVSVNASAAGYDSAVQLLDLPAGEHGDAHFALKRHKESIADLQSQIQRSGTVAVYGIHFDTASATLRPESATSLQTILRLVQSMPDSRWIIAGHTDNQGGADYNLKLSLARANSVVAWLVKHGVAANRLTAKGYGLTRPVADNATENGRALNRRVEVSIVR